MFSKGFFFKVVKSRNCVVKSYYDAIKLHYGLFSPWDYLDLRASLSCSVLFSGSELQDGLKNNESAKIHFLMEPPKFLKSKLKIAFFCFPRITQV